MPVRARPNEHHRSKLVQPKFSLGEALIYKLIARDDLNEEFRDQAVEMMLAAGLRIPKAARRLAISMKTLANLL